MERTLQRTLLVIAVVATSSHLPRTGRRLSGHGLGEDRSAAQRLAGAGHRADCRGVGPVEPQRLHRFPCDRREELGLRRLGICPASGVRHPVFNSVTSASGTFHLDPNVSLVPDQWHHVAATSTTALPGCTSMGTCWSVDGLTAPSLDRAEHAVDRQWRGAVVRSDRHRADLVGCAHAKPDPAVEEPCDPRGAGARELLEPGWQRARLDRIEPRYRRRSHHLQPGAPIIPHLHAPPTAVIGQPMVFSIDHGSAALTPYLMDISITGTSPGIVLAPGLVIPLEPAAPQLLSWASHCPERSWTSSASSMPRDTRRPWSTCLPFPLWPCAHDQRRLCDSRPISTGSLDFVSIPSTTLLAVGP